MQKINTGQLTIRDFEPLTQAQHVARDSFLKQKHIFYVGCPGTGKTFLALQFAVEELFNDKSKNKIIIIRSCVPSRDVGFLPGSIDEKMQSYEAPYPIIINDIFGRGDAYGILKKKGLIVFESTSFLRGQTIDDSIVVVDEFQNMCENEIHTIMSRIGENTKLHVCGDIDQSDLQDLKKAGAKNLLDIARNITSIDIHNFTEEDIVRSGFCREYILAKMKNKSPYFLKKVS